MTAMVIQGYCIPWRRVAHVGGVYETVLRTCFDEFLATRRRPNVELLWGAHDGKVIGSCVELHNDHYGLSFGAEVHDPHWRAIRALLLSSSDSARNRCSVNFVGMDVERIRHHGRVIQRVICASINHIALVGNSAAYEATGCWPSGSREVPPRVKPLREKYRAAEELRLCAERRAERERRYQHHGLTEAIRPRPNVNGA